MSHIEDLGLKIRLLYGRAGFGRVLKSELDLAYFHYFLMENLGVQFRDGKKIKFLHIDKAEIYRLSVKGGMTESRFKKLLEETFLISREELSTASFLLDLINQLRIKKSVLVAGKLKLILPNPIARKYLEDRAYQCGASIDYENNQEIVSIDVENFLKVVEVSETRDAAALIRDNMLAKAELVEKNPEIKAFFEDLNAVPLEERISRIGKALLEKFTGRIGEEFVASILTILKKPATDGEE